MKTLKTLFAALAISMIAAPAFAEPPSSAQRGLEKAEQHKRVKEKRERAEKPSKADRADKGAGKEKALKEKGAKEKASKQKTRAEDERNESSAKGLDRTEREDRKHLRRLASIDRIAEIAQRNGNARLLERAEMLRAKEELRFARAADRLETNGRTHVGPLLGD